ncbi:MAG: molybdate ABC transporter substrate-binding protein [Alphaproteobacteria bacterium]|nr:molybdate ABC transporter substrate-binding protein [Alphaproteobacteria bacterium]
MVFAAASTREAVLAITTQASRELGIPIVASFAASSALARQIEAGAPAHLYLSADVAWMDRLESIEAIAGETRHDLVRNRLVLIAPRATVSLIRQGLLTSSAALFTALGGGRLAIADPDAVPAGVYGRQALESLGLWDGIAGHLAPAANVRAALALVERGAAPLGLVYATDAKASANVVVVGRVPQDSHAPIVYPIALTKRGDADRRAHRLLQAFLAPSGRAVFTAHGFEPVQP